MSGPRDYTLTFTGAGLQEIKARGKFLRVMAAPSAALFISLNGGSELERLAGQSINVAEGEQFTVIRVRSTVAQTIRFNVSDVHQDDDQESVSVTVSATVDPGNTIDNGADVSCGATAATQVLAADLTRLVAQVTNLIGNTDAVRVGGVSVGAASGQPCEPGETIFLATTAAVYVYNPKASAQTVAASAVQEI